MTQNGRLQTVILGASGYTGAELLRFLLVHPYVNIVALTGESQAGQSMASVYPHLAFANLPDLVKIAEVDFTNVDVVFCCLPHGTTQKIIAALPKNVRVVDLSADFRLRDADTYAKWYGHAHQAQELQKEAVYGLSENQRDAIADARLVANPGCYPTSTLLPLQPLIEAKQIQTERLIIDAKSGVSGAGRAASRALNFCETSEGMHAYSVGNHRHMSEMEQELAVAAGETVEIQFTPHLIPMRRGMLTTIYAQMPSGVTLEDVRATLSDSYANEPFVHLVDEGVFPATHHVRGSNHCHIAVFAGRSAQDITIVSVIDNLVKGASGQAVQNMNIMFGMDEITGLEGGALFP